ncbi:MAG: hypothetical protein ACTSO7_03965, partial [Candidatus Heimdallarchaeota archaeon]
MSTDKPEEKGNHGIAVGFTIAILGLLLIIIPALLLISGEVVPRLFRILLITGGGIAVLGFIVLIITIILMINKTGKKKEKPKKVKTKAKKK